MCMTNYQEIWVESLLFHDIISLNVEFLHKLLLTSTFSHLEIKVKKYKKTSRATSALDTSVVLEFVLI